MRSALLVAVLVACNGGSEDSVPLTNLEGVYTIDTWTLNASACDAEGPAVRRDDRLFYIKDEALFGTRFLNVNPCGSRELCQAQARDDTTVQLGQWGLDFGNDIDGWTSDNTFAFELNGTCEATRSITTLTAAGDTVRIEQRDHEGTFPPEADGSCPDAQAVEVTRDAPCATLEVATATFNATF